jgi:hypothetical protein
MFAQTCKGEINLAGVVELTQATGKRLIAWSIASITFGTVMILSTPGTVLAGIGVQAIIWGAIDVAIARSILLKRKEQSIAKITRTVSFSIYFDIIAQVVGLIVIVLFFQDPYLMGNGLGVVIQGFFLLLLDRSYYNSLENLEIPES